MHNGSNNLVTLRYRLKDVRMQAAEQPFDKFEVPFDPIYKDQVKAGNLRATYDLILIPTQSRSARNLVYDIEPKGQPVDYKKSERLKTLGMYGESNDVTGGMGLQGAAELESFVNDGGVFVTMGVASFFPPEFGLTRTIDAQRTSPQFYAPGPIIAADILKPAHPISHLSPWAPPARRLHRPLLRRRQPSTSSSAPPTRRTWCPREKRSASRGGRTSADSATSTPQQHRISGCCVSRISRETTASTSPT